MSHSISGMHWYPNAKTKNDLFSSYQYIPENCPPICITDLITPPPPPSCRNSTAHSHDFNGTLEHRHTHLQQPTDWNINARHTDTTMSTVPTHATLLHYTSSSEEESSNPGKPPSNQTIVGSTLDHGGLNHTAATHAPMQTNDEDNTFEADLNDLEQAEESTVVIPSIPTVQEIT